MLVVDSKIECWLLLRSRVPQRESARRADRCTMFQHIALIAVDSSGARALTSSKQQQAKNKSGASRTQLSGPK